MKPDADGEGGGDGIKVTDRRRFTEEGEAREASPDAETRTAGDEGAGAVPSSKSAEEPAAGKRAEQGPLPPADFSTFLLSLAASAEVHLGALPNPATGKRERDLALARQTIDLIGMLEEKTKGNLTEGEGRLLERVLFDLRMMYVEAGKGG